MSDKQRNSGKPLTEPPWLVRFSRRLDIRLKWGVFGFLCAVAVVIPAVWLVKGILSVGDSMVDPGELFMRIIWALSIQGAGLALCFIYGRAVIRDMSTAMSVLEAASRAVIEGDSAVDIRGEPRSDEIGRLADVLREMLEVNGADRRKLIEGNVALLVANDRLAQANMDLESASGKVRQLAAEAGAANVAKRNFLAVMSHEIRTPVNGIIGMTELALQTQLSAEQRDYLDTVNSSAQSLLDLLNDVLDFSKIEAGKLELERADFKIRDMLDETLAAYAPRAHSKGLELLLDVRSDVPETLIGDSHRLRQVILNLVSNAIRFTSCGEVVVRVETERADWNAGDAILRFSVIDSGCGIPASKTGVIFEAFAQADGSITRQFGGTGLGLSISRELVGLMQGEIRVTSEVDRGSIFTFTARLGIRAGATPELPMVLAGRRALLFEPHPLSASLIQEKLGAMNVTCICCGGADAAITQVQDGGFDFLIVDTFRSPAELPRFVAAAARAGASGRRPSIVALRGSHLQGGGELEGVAGILLKPVGARRLRSLLYSALTPSELRERKCEPSETRAPHGRRLRILVAEDNATNRRIVKGFLSNWGHSVTLCEDGEDAMSKWEDGAFDLILMDLQMPKLDGIAAARRIRAFEAERKLDRTPIIALTANVLKGIRDECAKAGMDGYLGKPMREHDLLRALEEAVPGLHRSEAGSERRSAEGSGLRPGASYCFDAAALLSSVGGSRATVAGLLSDCRDEDLPEMMTAVESALSAGDCRSLARAAHAIKGVVGVFQAPRAHFAALRLEAAALGESFDILRRNAEELRDAVSELLSHLEAFLSDPQAQST
ncbi:MAG: Signal transduction histidine-protein kinase BarA [Verrucomicrobiota bacterium]